MAEGNETPGVPLDEVPEDEVEARMRPGEFSQVGFLGAEESLRDVLDADARTLLELGVTARAMAERLFEILESALESKLTAVSAGHFRVQVTRYKGPQICPFAPDPFENPCQGFGGMRLASIDWEIRNTRNRLRMTGPGLIAHLIGMHSFFEGMNSPYRVDPRALAELLELGRLARPTKSV